MTVILNICVGAVFHYVIVNLVLLWYFHVAIFFHKVMFPFQANRFEKMGRNKYIFATVTILCKFVCYNAHKIYSLHYKLYYFHYQLLS